MDSYGSGNFMASRDGGSRSHLGRDYIAMPTDETLFPIHGVIERRGLAYSDSALGSIHIRGVGEHRGLLVKLLYSTCDHAVGYEGKAGERLGSPQDVTTRYPGITNHIHLEVWVATDPDTLIGTGTFPVSA